MGTGCKICIGGMSVNCVGVDISKGKSMIAVMRPLGEMVIPPFEVRHTDSELCELSRLLEDLDGETRVVMEATGNYHLPVASFLFPDANRLFSSPVKVAARTGWTLLPPSGTVSVSAGYPKRRL